MVAVNLAVAASRAGQSVHLCDCDVEEPNAHLFLNPEFERSFPATDPIPLVDQAVCKYCGECGDICEFNAIACLPEKTMTFHDLCHGCGGCWLVCPHQAITPGKRILGDISTGSVGDLTFTMGRLRVGEIRVPPVIDAVKMVPGDQKGWVLLDAPPGATCPVVETLREVDYVVLVTEPTPFGLHDLDLVFKLTRELGLPSGVVINRDHGQPGPVDAFCLREGIEILARIPFSRQVAEVCAAGDLVLDADPKVASILTDLYGILKLREAAA
jgi:MinD superfamily P-loop ATPase